MTIRYDDDLNVDYCDKCDKVMPHCEVIDCPFCDGPQSEITWYPEPLADWEMELLIPYYHDNPIFIELSRKHRIYTDAMSELFQEAL